jgi:DNA polymerase-3 subunit delta
MKLRLEQLNAHLGGALTPLYVVHGDEPLLVQEAADAIRNAARGQGYNERECFSVDARFDWDGWRLNAASFSLFSGRRLQELRLETTKLGEAGGKALRIYAERPPEDALLLVICARVDAAAQRGGWFKALDAAGVMVQVWPVAGRQLPGWIKERMHARGLRPTAEAVGLLAQRVEGNLLAAAQEIEKLYVLFGTGTITAEQMIAVVTDSARYSVYDLVDAALVGRADRVVRILAGLRSEGVETILVSWALHREISLLYLLKFQIDGGTSSAAALAQNNVWEKRKPVLHAVLQRLSTSLCRRLLLACARVDRVVKGADEGDPWDELLRLGLGLAGKTQFVGPSGPNRTELA